MTKIANKRNDPYDVYIGRGSKWGNPYSHLDNTKALYKVATREESIAKYEEWIRNQPDLLADLHELEGKILGCYCKPLACHGDILIKLLEEKKLQHMPKIKLAVISSQTFNEKERLFKILDKKMDRISLIISGNSKNGADFLARQWAEERGVPVLTFHARRFDLEGNVDRGATFRKQREVLSAADRILCFHDGVSEGTAKMLEMAEQLNKQVILLKFQAAPKEVPKTIPNF